MALTLGKMEKNGNEIGRAPAPKRLPAKEIDTSDSDSSSTRALQAELSLFRRHKPRLTSIMAVTEPGPAQPALAVESDKIHFT